MSSRVWIDTSPAAHLYLAFAHVMASVVTRRLSSQSKQRWGMKRKKRQGGGHKKEKQGS